MHRAVAIDRDLDHAVRVDGFLAENLAHAFRIDVPGFSGFTKIVHDATQRKLVQGKKDLALARQRADYTEIQKLSRLKDEFIEFGRVCECLRLRK